jgi:riboflavin synthase
VFTGIVEEVGKVREVSSHRLVVGAATALEGLAEGDSISINGVCLTVVAHDAHSFAVDIVDETLERTNLGRLQAGHPVNLERALTPESRMGGHIVQGHIDDVGTLVELSGTPEATVLRVDAPEAVARYVVEKGFIAVDGISLTVTEVSGSTFSVAVIPYTLQHTVLGSREPGDHVNLEVDIVAKYVERLLPER